MAEEEGVGVRVDPEVNGHKATGEQEDEDITTTESVSIIIYSVVRNV